MHLVLHIGTEKTGTTAIQNFVYRNRAELARQGLYLTDCLGKNNNRKLVQYCLPVGRIDEYFLQKGVTTPAQKEAHFAGFLDSLRAEVTTGGSGATFIITSEHLHSRLTGLAPIRKLHGVLADLFESTRIACYFREQAGMATSAYSTALKAGNRNSFAVFSRNCTPESGYYNHALSFGRWRDVFGAGSLRPRIFDRRLFFREDIRSDFLELIRPGLSASPYVFAPTGSNESLGLPAMAIIRANNILNPSYLPDGKPNPLGAGWRRLISDSRLLATPRMSNPRSQEIYDLFTPVNREFAREYLDQRDNPFTPPKSDAEPAVDDAADIAERLIRFANEALLENPKGSGEDDGFRLFLHRMAEHARRGGAKDLIDPETIDGFVEATVAG